MISPAAGSTLTGGFDLTLNFSAPTANNCNVAIGPTQGSAEYDWYQSVPCTTVTALNIPTNSSTVWVRIFANYAGGSPGSDFKFTASAPLPLPSPTSAGNCQTVGTVTGMPYCPYAATSVWNQALPASPAINANSAAMIAGVMQNYTWNGPFSVDPPTAFGGFPTYFTHPGDPTVNIVPSASYGNVSGPVPMPANAVSATGTDAHLVVLNAANGNEWDYYQFPQNQVITQGANVPVTVGGLTNYQTGTGWGEVTTAAGAALLGGLVTVDEFMSGTIHHALAMAPACNNGWATTPQLANVYPATANAAYTCPTSVGNGIPHGSRIWSDLTPPQVKALNLDNISSILLVALNQYGAFITDTNGWVAFDIRNLFEQPVTQTGMTWWYQNGGLPPGVPALNKQPVSFFTTHFHVLQTCVTQGGC